ncbi:MAG: hypothetical protein ACJA1L_000679 [Paracoccaceae bacterium]|jgi:hypothetical protein
MHGDFFMMGSTGGIGALLLLALDIWAIISVVTSRSGTLAKVVWVMAILFLPLLGFLVWLVTGPRSAR